MAKPKSKFWHNWKHVKVLPKGHRYSIGTKEFIIYVDNFKPGAEKQRYSIYTYPGLAVVFTTPPIESLWEARWLLEEYYYKRNQPAPIVSV